MNDDHCQTCGNWITCRKTAYADGSEVVNWQAEDGKGNCLLLGVDVPETFGCQSHKYSLNHIAITQKDGTTWSNWRHIPCPDCDGRGSTFAIIGSKADGQMCHRCAGTSRVRLYDDGYVGDEQSRKHPKEAPPPPPTCANCSKNIDAAWVTCPWCGAATDNGRISLCTQDSVMPDDPLALTPSPTAGRKASIKQQIMENANNMRDQGFL